MWRIARLWDWVMAGEPERPKPVPPPTHPAGSKLALVGIGARLCELARMRAAAALEPDPTDGAAAEVTMIRVDMLLDERRRLMGLTA